MGDFPDTAEVAIQATRPLPGPGHRFPNAGFTLTAERQVVSGKVANAVKGALPHTIVTDEDVSFEIVSEGDVPEPKAGLIAAVGQSTAENLAKEGITTLAEARAASDEELKRAKLVGDSTIKNKIRASEEDESDEDGEDS